MTNMTDSETDTFQNVFKSQNLSTFISAKGPNSSTNMSFRNMYPSAFNIPRNFERPRYAESAYDQRSVYSRRDVSPTSSLSYYRGGIDSHRSVYDRRGGSPMSMRTIDSNTSVSAMDIATAFKTMNFNKYDLRIIKEAYNKFLKSHQRRRIEKRRNRRYMKGGRFRSGGESGEEGSDSSVSSDDCRSTRSYRSNVLKDSSSCRSTRTNLSDFRRTMQESNMYQDRTENFRQNSLKNMLSLPPRSVKNSSQSRPLTHSSSFMTQRDRFKQGYLLPSQRFNRSTASQSIPEIPRRHNNFDIETRSDIVRSNMHMTQHSLVSSSGEEEIFEKTNDKFNDQNMNGKRILDERDINMPDKKRTKILPHDQIIDTKSKENKDKTKEFEFAKPQFPIKKITSIKNVMKPNSRVSISIKKTPVKQTQNTKKNKTPKSSVPAQKANDNRIESEKILPETKSKECVKPVSPKPVDTLISKSKEPMNTLLSRPDKVISKSKEPINSMSPRPVEKLISKSKQPLDVIPKITIEKEVHQETDLTQLSTTDMSLRPSFIKRKLFSQKTDIADNKNSSSDNIETTSPTNVYSAIQKEKNKTRKLVTSQSCLNHDLGDESNLIDLIHKIVPANRLNITSATNKTNIAKKPTNANKTSNGKKGKDLDISSLIASCSNDDVSDTFTDEEIFKTSVIDKTKKVDKENTKESNNEPVKSVEPPKNDLKETITNKKAENKKAEQKKSIVNSKEVQKKTTVKHATVVVEKLPPKNVDNVTKTVSNIGNGYARNCVKSFWDITIDSDIENTTPVKQFEKEAGTPKKTAKSSKVQKEQLTLVATDINVTSDEQTKPEAGTPKKKAKSSKAQKEQLTLVATDINVTSDEQTKTGKNKDVVITKLNAEMSPNGILSKESDSKQTAKAKPKKTTKNLKQAKQKSSPPILKNNKVVTNPIKTSNINTKDADKKQNENIAKVSKPVEIKDARNQNTAKVNKPVEIKHHTEKIKINNNTLRIRTCRTPKINRCCFEPSTTEDSLTDTTLYKSLRSRAVLSTTLNSDISLPKKTLVNKVKRNVTKKKDASLSDVSFTLPVDEISKRMSRTQNNISNIRTRRGDISLTFTPENDLNRTMTRSRSTNTVENLLDTPNSRPKRSICSKINTSISHTKNIRVPTVKVSKTRK